MDSFTAGPDGEDEHEHACADVGVVQSEDLGEEIDDLREEPGSAGESVES